MNQKLILGGMNQRLIDVENNKTFYCNNCNNEFDHVISFFPMSGSSEYYTCKFCNSVLPVNDLKSRRLKPNWYNFCDFCCFCCYY
jgi:uncharacterized Zn-finger protein